MSARALVIGVLAIGLTPTAQADSALYSGNRDIQVQEGSIRAEHQHGRGRAYVRIVDAESGDELLKLESPPLTYLWLSPGGRYLVGLSTIKVLNETQLLVVSRDGKIVIKRPVSCSSSSLSCVESKTNYIYWYDETNPQIEIREIDHYPRAVVVNPFSACAAEERADTALCADSPRRLEIDLESATQ